MGLEANENVETVPNERVPGGWRSRLIRKRVIIPAILIILAIIALILGLALGLTLRHKDQSPKESPATSANWRPAVGTTFQIVLQSSLDDTTTNADVYDIDLFYNNRSTVAHLHSAGHKVVCYFSAGSYEVWRYDWDEFQPSDLGSPLTGWGGERWLDINSKNVRNIMRQRLDFARQKGCDGVDPGNVDAYDNYNGLRLTRAHAADYVNWLANETHARDMSMGLNNAGALIPYVIKNMQWSINEQCVQDNTCSTYGRFIKAKKPVFHIEYPKGATANNTQAVTKTQQKKACGGKNSKRFSTIMKNMDLDSWIQTC